MDITLKLEDKLYEKIMDIALKLEDELYEKIIDIDVLRDERDALQEGVASLMAQTVLLKEEIRDLKNTIEPCGQCGKQTNKQIVFTTKDDYCRDIDCFVCPECLTKAIKQIKE